MGEGGIASGGGDGVEDGALVGGLECVEGVVAEDFVAERSSHLLVVTKGGSGDVDSSRSRKVGCGEDAVSFDRCLITEELLLSVADLVGERRCRRILATERNYISLHVVDGKDHAVRPSDLSRGDSIKVQGGAHRGKVDAVKFRHRN